MTLPSLIDPSSKVWLITGCSTGIGRGIALAALDNGHHVIATARKVEKLEELKAKGATIFALDVTSSDDELAGIVAQAVNVYNRIDILVNNAGYSIEGGVEECSEVEVFDQFNTNTFGVLRMQRVVLPYMRAQKSGVVANIGSVGGRVANPPLGIYAATKFAVAGITMALKAEVAHLGVDAVCIEPGWFRTSILSSVTHAKKSIPELQLVLQPARDYLATKNQELEGDPAKAGQLIVEALTKTGRCEGCSLPTRMYLGSDTPVIHRTVMEMNRVEFENWTALVTQTDCDDVQK